MKIFQYKNLSYESFPMRKFPDLQYMTVDVVENDIFLSDKYTCTAPVQQCI